MASARYVTSLTASSSIALMLTCLLALARWSRAMSRPSARAALQSQFGASASTTRATSPESRLRTLDPQSLTRHVDRLYRAAWALCGSREDAEDLVQETFARVLARPRVLTGDDELYYLLRVLRNTFLTGRRTAGRRPVTVAELENSITADHRPQGQPERALEMQEVYATIAALPEDRRLALVAVDVLGLSYREAARALRVREATITTRLYRAREQVARSLRPAAESPASAGSSRDAARTLTPLTSPARTDGGTPRQPPDRSGEREGIKAAGVFPGRGTP